MWLGPGEGGWAPTHSGTGPRQLAQLGCLGVVVAVTRHDSPPGCGRAMGRALVPHAGVLGGVGDRFVAVSRKFGVVDQNPKRQPFSRHRLCKLTLRRQSWPRGGPYTCAVRSMEAGNTGATPQAPRRCKSCRTCRPCAAGHALLCGATGVPNL